MKETRDFKKKWFKFTDYVPHKGQERLHFPTKDARFIVAVCGRRWGKSVSAAKEIECVITQPKKRAWVVAPSYQLAEKVYYEIQNDNLLACGGGGGGGGGGSSPAARKAKKEKRAKAKLNFKKRQLSKMAAAGEPTSDLQAEIEALEKDLEDLKK